MFKPIKLPYSYEALEPYIDSETMNIHYNKHYMSYLDNLNEEVGNYRNLDSITINYLIKNLDNLSKKVRDNAGGYYNHSLFWLMLKPSDNSDNLPFGIVKKIMDRDFGSYTNFQQKIKDTAKKRFGSGWVWWILMPNGKTEIVETPYQDNPKMFYKCEILLGIDVWEHAYYLKYQADRMAYVNNIFNIINWDYSNNILNDFFLVN